MFGGQARQGFFQALVALRTLGEYRWQATGQADIGVVAALEQGEIEQVIIGDAQALHDGRAQVFFGMVDWQLEFGNS